MTSREHGHEMNTDDPSGNRPKAGSLWFARLMWLIPLALLVLTVQQALATRDIGRTLDQGTPAMAEVLRYNRVDRKDVTFAEVDLRVRMPDGTDFTRTHLALPYSLAHRIENDSVLAVQVLPGSGQEVVIMSIARTQRSITLANAAMALIALILASVGVGAWNRFLGKKS